MPASNRNLIAAEFPSTDYRQLNRELLLLMMRHYTNLKDQYPNVIFVVNFREVGLC